MCVNTQESSLPATECIWGPQVLPAQAVESLAHPMTQCHGGGNEHVYWVIFISLDRELHHGGTVLVSFTAVSLAPTAVPAM